MNIGTSAAAASAQPTREHRGTGRGVSVGLVTAGTALMVGAIPGILHREPLTALAGAGLAGAIGIAAGIGAGIAIGRSTDRSSDMSASSAGGAIGGAVGGAALALASRNFRPTALLAPIVGAGLGALAGLVGSVASDHALQSPFD